MAKRKNQLPTINTGVSIGRSTSGTSVSENEALTLDAVLACVNVLAQSIASLPLELIYTQAKGKAKDHSLYQLVKFRPNPEMSSYEFRHWLMCDALIRGTGYAQIVRDEKGEVLELWPLPAQSVKPTRQDGELWFSIGEDVLPDADVLRVQSLPSGGLQGRSLIALAQASLGLAKAENDFAGEFLANAVAPSLLIEFPADINQQQAERISAAIESYKQGGRRHRILPLDSGCKVTPLTVNASESQLLESRKYSRTVIAGLFRVPPHMIGDLSGATFSNVEQQNLSFVQHSLAPWLQNIEQRLRMSLLKPEEWEELAFKFNLNGIMRGDISSRFSAYNIAINCGFMTRNEVRALEDLAPIDGLDTPVANGTFTQTN